jgi:hypothetical protein
MKLFIEIVMLVAALAHAEAICTNAQRDVVRNVFLATAQNIENVLSS